MPLLFLVVVVLVGVAALVLWTWPRSSGKSLSNSLRGVRLVPGSDLKVEWYPTCRWCLRVQIMQVSDCLCAGLRTVSEKGAPVLAIDMSNQHKASHRCRMQRVYVCVAVPGGPQRHRHAIRRAGSELWTTRWVHVQCLEHYRQTLFRWRDQTYRWTQTDLLGAYRAFQLLANEQIAQALDASARLPRCVATFIFEYAAAL